MPNKHDKNNLFLYIGISVILHLFILYFLPIGFLQGNARSEGELNDYGYVQLVNYQPSPVQVDEPEEEAEVDQTEDEIQDIEDDEKEVETEDIIEEPEEIEEEQVVEENIEEEAIEEEREIVEELTEEPQENIEEEIDEVVENTEEIIEQAEEEAAEDNVDDGVQEEENIMSSEESESEIEVEQEEQNTQESADEEQEQQQSSESSEESSEQSVQEEEENTPPPPPPPTSGDLINLVVTPAFPKDLVGTRSEGKVRLIAEISRQGNVDNITIQESSGFESMDRVALITVERGWTFKEYQQPYRIPVLVNYYFDESDNTQVDIELGEVEFISGGE